MLRDGACFAVGDKKIYAIAGETARLSKRCKARLIRSRRQKFAIGEVLATVSSPRTDLGFVERHLPNLMWASHGDVESILMNPKIPRAVQAGIFGNADEAAQGA